ncbi:MAG: ankyrin repeat domain-containing protein [Spirochaetales bacterium]|nr:ankyrin repeat domain-containing protein [Spirochaetales bacterium]
MLCYFLDRTPLHSAAGSGCRELVLFLLENGADIDARVKEYDSYNGYDSADGETPLMLAIREGHVDIVKILVDR